MSKKGNIYIRRIISLLMAAVMVLAFQSAVFADEQATDGDGTNPEVITTEEPASTEATEPSGEPAEEEPQTEIDPEEATEPTEETLPTEPTVSVAAVTDWKCPSSGKYTMTLKSDGSVLELHTAAGQSVGGYDTVQGGCVNEGIGYFSLSNRNNTKYAKIVKVDMSTGEVIKVSDALKIYHANDLTYNTKKDKIIVAHAEGDRKHLSAVDPGTLKVTSTKKITVSTKCGMTKSEVNKYIGFGAVAYNEKHDEYVLRLNNLGNILVLNSSFEPVRYVKLSKKMGQIYQGMDSINDYILLGVSPKQSGQYNMIAVYDYKGKYKKQIKIRKSFELESVMHDEGKTYIAMYEEGTIKNKAGTLRNDFVMKLGSDDGKYLFPVVPYQNSEVALRNSTMNKWLSSYTKSAIKNYKTGKNIYYPKTVKLRWSIDEGVKASYKVKVSESKKMTNARSFSTSYACVTVGNLKANTTYYWKVSSSYSGKTVESNVAVFKTGKGPRTLKVSKVGNIRDIGGWKTSDGGVIKQGMVYRSAHMDNINSDGKKVMLNTLGVKTDLDLRQKGNGLAGKKSPLGSGVKYVQFGTSGGVFNDDANTSAGRKTIAKEIRVFADSSNYPIAVHCQIGRDRTGLVCYLIGALAGVSPTDLMKDYQISFLSKSGNTYMSKVGKSYTYISKLETMLRTYGEEGESLQKCTEKYLLKCGLKQKELDAIKSNIVQY